ncbi:hypothetical protein EJ03DRAFT_169510 [Teratosphaeria nubilosa]|uniref:C2H2-type domain-containing protein n=1 Tax=Teratosphaeria nubilosa TaxID=161662 RepID=A0A6G1LIF4_9PEZI|nr:hypothetical protein EJ03DRAFT_169510 [Teratosphaeria nubilosa]
MSYFPSPDPEKLRAVMAQRAAFMQTPSTPAAQEHLFRQYASQEQNTDGMMLHTPYPSAVHEPRGLALVSMPDMAPGNQILHSKVDAQPIGLPYAWPSQYMATPMADAQPSRQDFFGQGYGAPSTVLPSMLWNTHQAATRSMPEYDNSPSISAYSASSHASVTCSPPAFSEGYVTAGSPRIKLEPSLDHSEDSMPALSWTNPTGEPCAVNPGDLVTKPAPSVLQRCPISLPPSVDGTFHSKSEDIKPIFRGSPSSRRRSELLDELLDDLCGERQKRGYTKPETASCACDKCGKLYQRPYNLKAHMETHDPHRGQPHACMYEDCDKRFVRRTDLSRHGQSVRRAISVASTKLTRR